MATDTEILNALIVHAVQTGALAVERNGNVVSLKAFPKGMGIKTTVVATKLLRDTANG